MVSFRVRVYGFDIFVTRFGRCFLLSCPVKPGNMPWASIQLLLLGLDNYENVGILITEGEQKMRDKEVPIEHIRDIPDNREKRSGAVGQTEIFLWPPESYSRLGGPGLHPMPLTRTGRPPPRRAYTSRASNHGLGPVFTTDYQPIERAYGDSWKPESPAGKRKVVFMMEDGVDNYSKGAYNDYVTINHFHAPKSFAKQEYVQWASHISSQLGFAYAPVVSNTKIPFEIHATNIIPSYEIQVTQVSMVQGRHKGDVDNNQTIEKYNGTKRATRIRSK
ncbi:hypothetical protein B0J17DRAFT_703874 [Rhizoctonia solani]|nr:hypothetical protein B0J17DRAFT_703874 [Rhizoctonia solani]